MHIFFTWSTAHESNAGGFKGVGPTNAALFNYCPLNTMPVCQVSTAPLSFQNELEVGYDAHGRILVGKRF